MRHAVREIIVWAEQRNNQLMAVSLEMLSKAVELAGILNGTVSAILIGDECSALSDDLFYYGAEKIFLVEDHRLALYQSGAYAKIIGEIVSHRSPEIVLIGGTSIGMDVAPRVAAKLGTGLTAHCVDLFIEDIDGADQLIQIVPGWRGRMMVKTVCPEKRPQMVTVRPGVFEKGKPDTARTGDIVSWIPDLSENDFAARSLEMVEERTEGVSLENADVIVSGGFGLYSAGGFHLVEQLAQALHGETGGTRPALDHGWITEEQLIGQSGKNVRPNLFVSMGASGAMHYTTGFVKSKVIVAIDKNPGAPIFKSADIGIVGDIHTIVPCIIEVLKEP